MKCNELKRVLKKAGCYIQRNGRKHDVWYSPVTGLVALVPRHGREELSFGTLRDIKKKMFGL